MTTRFSVFLLTMVAACAVTAAAQAEDFSTAKGVASALQQRYETVRTFTADVAQTLTASATGVAEPRTGSIAFQKPGLVRWETVTPDPELLVVGQSFVWNYFPQEKTAYKYALSTVMNSKTMLRFVTGQARLDEDFELSPPDAPDEEGLVRMELLPHEPEPSLVQAIVWVDPKTSLLAKVRIYDFYGNENFLEFQKIVVNQELAESTFVFTPPNDVDVVDDTQGLAPTEKNLPK